MPTRSRARSLPSWTEPRFCDPRRARRISPGNPQEGLAETRDMNHTTFFSKLADSVSGHLDMTQPGAGVTAQCVHLREWTVVTRLETNYNWRPHEGKLGEAIWVIKERFKLPNASSRVNRPFPATSGKLFDRSLVPVLNWTNYECQLGVGTNTSPLSHILANF